MENGIKEFEQLEINLWENSREYLTEFDLEWSELKDEECEDDIVNFIG